MTPEWALAVTVISSGGWLPALRQAIRKSTASTGCRDIAMRCIFSDKINDQRSHEAEADIHG
jgi:hypothetical protein